MRAILGKIQRERERERLRVKQMMEMGSQWCGVREKRSNRHQE